MPSGSPAGFPTNAENVDFAPELICGGDIPGHSTITHEYVDTPWNKGRRRRHEPRVHHRFAVNLGQPLWKFKSSKHLMQTLHDAFTCHRQAVERCRILHRDISAWNILCDETSGRGILSDWDQCARLPPLVGPSELDPSINMMAELPPSDGRRPERTGTWAFASTLSLNHLHRLHDVQDDLESFFWVAVFIIILYLPVDREVALRVVDKVLSQVQYNTDGVPFGGDGKRTFLSGVSDRYRLVFTEPVSAPLLEWIGMYRRMVGQWVAYQDGLRSWLGRQRRRELARQSEAEGKGDGDGSGDEDASGEDDESDEDDEDDSDEDDDGGDEDEYVVDSMDDEDNDPEPQAPSLRDYQKRDREWRLILKKGRNMSTVQEGGREEKGRVQEEQLAVRRAPQPESVGGHR
ncbi:hypothetical protein EV714DRAFT_275717 [Schizophyllum commune]